MNERSLGTVRRGARALYSCRAECAQGQCWFLKLLGSVAGTRLSRLTTELPHHRPHLAPKKPKTRSEPVVTSKKFMIGELEFSYKKFSGENSWKKERNGYSKWHKHLVLAYWSLFSFGNANAKISGTGACISIMFILLHWRENESNSPAAAPAQRQPDARSLNCFSASRDLRICKEAITQVGFSSPPVLPPPYIWLDFC